MYSKVNQAKTYIFPPLLHKPPYRCARAMSRYKKRSAKVPFVKKTTVLCWSFLFISLCLSYSDPSCRPAPPPPHPPRQPVSPAASSPQSNARTAHSGPHTFVYTCTVQVHRVHLLEKPCNQPICDFSTVLKSVPRGPL